MEHSDENSDNQAMIDANPSVPLGNGDHSHEMECPPDFFVKDEATANWVVRRIIAARQYAGRVEMFAAAELRRAQNEEDWLMRRFSSQLEAWLRDTLMRGKSNRRSVSLPAGRLGLRLQPSRLEFYDHIQVQEWARTHLLSAVRVHVVAVGPAALEAISWHKSSGMKAELEVSVSKAALSKHLRTTGELPLGCTVIEGSDQMRID